AVAGDAGLRAAERGAPGSGGLARVAAGCGAGVLDDDGGLDRSALASIVFGDERARERLNATVHPEVRRLSAERDALAGAADDGAVIVHDVPLLVEVGLAESFHLLIVVDAPPGLRLARLVEGRGMTE